MFNMAAEQTKQNDKSMATANGAPGVLRRKWHGFRGGQMTGLRIVNMRHDQFAAARAMLTRAFLDYPLMKYANAHLRVGAGAWLHCMGPSCATRFGMAKCT